MGTAGLARACDRNLHSIDISTTDERLLENSSSLVDPTAQQNLPSGRITGVLWFFLCAFGALAAVGVYFFQTSLPNWELYLQLGSTGGAAALASWGRYSWYVTAW